MTLFKPTFQLLVAYLSVTSAFTINKDKPAVNHDFAIANPPTKYGVVVFSGFQAIGRNIIPI
jgi:hypothetical protein